MIKKVIFPVLLIAHVLVRWGYTDQYEVNTAESTEYISAQAETISPTAEPNHTFTLATAAYDEQYFRGTLLP